MVDGLHIPIWNIRKKPLVIASSGAGRGLRRRDDEGNVTNVQYNPNWNCHYESPSIYQIYSDEKFIKKITVFASKDEHFPCQHLG
jgi:hypothetical protein